MKSPHQVFLDRVSVCARKMIPGLELYKLNFRVETDMDYIADAMVVSLFTYMAGIGKERVEVHEEWPANWWEALKERWFPAWALRRWPVQKKSIHISKAVYHAVCPHLYVTGQLSKEHNCFAWLGEQSKAWRDATPEA